MLASILVNIDSLTCVACRAKLSFEKMDYAGGICVCDSGVFDAIVSVSTTSTFERDVGEAFTLATVGILNGGRMGLNLVTNANSATTTETRTYDLFALPGRTVYEIFKGTPQAAVELIRSLRREATKANLQDDQRICLECGGIFKVEFAGFTTEGYCSKLCKLRHSANKPVVETVSNKSLAPDNIMTCPACSKNTKVRAGKLVRCMWCGTTIHEKGSA